MPEQLESIKTSCLPPPEVRFWSEDDKIDTPVDERGLVLVPELIALVKATIDPDYQWPVDETNVHHFYWPAVWYPHVDAREEEFNTASFRNQSINKGLLPLVFHNWLHRVTTPPPLPEVEIMMYHAEAWSVAKSLFHSVKNAQHWERRAWRSLNEELEAKPDEANEEVVDEIDLEKIEYIMDKHFTNVDAHRKELAKVHPDFRLIDPDEPFERLVLRLGRIMAPPSLILTRLATS